MASKKVDVKTDAIEVASNSGIESVPDFMQEYKGQQLGQEAVEQTDLTMPRVALCQDLTPQRKKNDPKHIEGLETGLYFNTVTGQIYGEKFYFVPVKFNKAQMYCKPLNEGGGIICQSNNGKTGGKLNPESCETCPHNSWENGKPDCGKLQNFLGYVFTELPKDGTIPIDAAVLTFKSTSLKVGKNLNSLIRLANLPSFAKVYEVKAVDETRNSNTYAQHSIKPLGFVPKSVFEAGKELYEAMKDRDIQVDTTGLDDEGDGTTDFDTKGF